MKGTRSFTDDEIGEIKRHFEHKIGGSDDGNDLETRNMTLMFFGLFTGFRISEILSLKVKDIYQYGRVSESVYLQKMNTKGQRAGRTGKINDECRKILTRYLEHYRMIPKIPADGERALFFSRKGGSITPRQAGRLYDAVYDELEMDGKLGTHSTRKTFARKCYKNLGNSILDLKSAMGHSDLSSTSCYITPDEEKVQEALSNLSYGI